MLQGLIIAFAMYSKIPMPRADWTPENMKYSMCYFPLIGGIIGVMEAGAYYLLNALGFDGFFRGVMLAMVPILVTGGIHMDGFMDTMDARSSWGDREKKLEILKDSHTGAFAILGCVVYLLMNAAAWSEMNERGIWLAAAGFAISRCLSGIGVASFTCAKNSGLLHTFSSTAHKKRVRIVLILELAAICACILIYRPLAAICMILGALLVFGYYRWFSYKDFGGITGDLAGYFLQICELVMVLVIVVLLRGGIL